MFRKSRLETAAVSDKTRPDCGVFDGRAFARNVRRNPSTLRVRRPGAIRLRLFEGNRSGKSVSFISMVRAPSDGVQFSVSLEAEKPQTSTFYLQDRMRCPAGSYFRRLRPPQRPDAAGLRPPGVTLSPRFAFEIPLSRTRASALRITAGRYSWTLPLSWLAWGNADAPGSRTYVWTDANGDSLYTPDERGAFLRREGPRFGAWDEKLLLPSATAAVFAEARSGPKLAHVAGRPPARTRISSDEKRACRSLPTPPGRSPTTATYDPDITTICRSRFTIRILKRSAGISISSPIRRFRPRSVLPGPRSVLIKRRRTSSSSSAATATHAVQTTVPQHRPGKRRRCHRGLYDHPNASSTPGPLDSTGLYVRIGFSRDLPWDTRLGVVARITRPADRPDRHRRGLAKAPF
jgi:hypothetical protein